MCRGCLPQSRPLNARTATAGADPLPDGPSNTPSTLIHPKPFQLTKCNKLGACTAAEVDNIWQQAYDSDALPDGFSIGYWRPLWEAQEKLHANPKATPALADWWVTCDCTYTCSRWQTQTHTMPMTANVKSAQSEA
jgi:hypothetical protein